MDKLQAIKITLCGLFGSIGGAIAHFFGGWSKDMTTLIILMGADFVLGLVVAGVFQKSKKSESGALESRASWKGICRKGGTLLIVLIAHRLDLALGVDFVRTATVIAYIVNESISILENVGLMGVPIPKKLRQAIEILKDKAEEDEEEPEDNPENVFYEGDEDE